MKPNAAFATLEDYKHFHGMLCRPETAQRCIESFSGSILFLPQDYNSPDDYDFTPPYLTVVTYYLLVLLSFTGLSSLFGMTRVHCAEEYATPMIVTSAVSSQSDSSLVVRDDCWEYIHKKFDCQTLRLSRRLEYEFLLGNLSVVMFHLVCENHRLHLVEVYQWKVPLFSKFFHVMFDVFSWIVRQFHRPKGNMTLKMD